MNLNSWRHHFHNLMTTNALEHTKALLIHFIMHDAVNFRYDGQIQIQVQNVHTYSVHTDMSTMPVMYVVQYFRGYQISHNTIISRSKEET